MVKEIAGAGIILADIIAGFAAPDVIKMLHGKPGPAAYPALGLAVVLAALTVWVIVSLVKGPKSKAAPVQPVRRYSGIRQ